MLAADKSFRSLKNPGTGFDISVPSVHEVEAPLGGTSVEYGISVMTNLAVYKSSLYKEEDVVRYCIQRAYREIEDFYEKIEKKFKDVSLPSIPRGRDVQKYSTEEKRAVLDAFMQHISKHNVICQSTLFSNFLGINKLKSQTAKMEVSSEDSIDPNCNSGSKSSNISCNKDAQNHISANLEDANLSELFPKVKMRKASKPELNSELKCSLGDNDLPLFSAGKERTNIDDEDLDLFEEAKKVSYPASDESYKKSKAEMLEDFNEDERLFSNIPAKKIVSSAAKEDEIHARRPSSNENQKNVQDDNKSARSILPDEEKYSKPKEVKDISFGINEISLRNEIQKEIKNAGVSLFEEQDFGTAIMEDDERLFLVEKTEEKKTTVNPFLSPTADDTDDPGVVESLEDLMSVQQPSITLVKQQKEHQPDSEDSRTSKPPVPLKKPVQQKPQIAPKPSVAQKPVLPPKPKVTKKPSIVDAATPDAGQKRDDSSVANSSGSKLFDEDELASFDIMKYIEQEEKIASAGASLFD